MKYENFKHYGIMLICVLLIFTLHSCGYYYHYKTQKLDAVYIVDSSFTFPVKSKYYTTEKNEDDYTILKVFSMDSVLLSVSQYSIYDSTNIPPYLRIGEQLSFYPDGKIRVKEYFDYEGERDKNQIFYYQNGQIKRHDIFKRGIFISGKCYDSLGRRMSHTTYIYGKSVNFDIKSYINCIKCPDILKGNKRKEIFIARILIDTTGKLVQIRYDSGNSPEFINKISKCFVNLKFTPAIVDNEPINYWLTIGMDSYDVIWK